jgi:plastocyanin
VRGWDVLEGRSTMKSRYSLVAAATAALVTAFVVATAAFGSSSSTKLIGTTGANDAFKITLTKGGHSVKTLAAGSYTFVIHDGSTIHSFALDGPHGFAKDFTTVPFKGTKTATIKLKAGKYKYYCKAHESQMFGHFTVH